VEKRRIKLVNKIKKGNKKLNVSIRQISGWNLAITGGLALLIGIISVYIYINLYVI